MSGIWTLWMVELMLSMVWFMLMNYSPRVRSKSVVSLSKSKLF